LYEDDWNGLDWSNGGRVGVVWLYEDEWNGLEWSDGGRVGVIDCIKMIRMH